MMAPWDQGDGLFAQQFAEVRPATFAARRWGIRPQRGRRLPAALLDLACEHRIRFAPEHLSPLLGTQAEARLLEPLGIDLGDPLGDLKFYYGTMPGADWHFVNAEGREVLTALQHRLRELGESTEIVVVK
jgi:hypothetical protein